MIYQTGNRQIDKSRTKVKLNSSYDLYHEYVQFMENYARAMFEEDWDMSQLHFYISDPEKGNSPVSVEDALEQLESGYPIFVKHDNSNEVLPFMKRGDEIYTGADFAKEQKHPEINLGFDYDEFMNEPEPPRPSILQYILGFIGFGDQTYMDYKLYKTKLELSRDNAYQITKNRAENDAYRYADELHERSGFADDMARIAKTPVEELIEAARKAKEPAAEITDEEIEAAGNLNIDALLQEAPEASSGKAAPQVPEEIQSELDSRDEANKKRELMQESEFMKGLMEQIRLNPGASKEDLVRGADFIRSMYQDTPEDISTEEFVEYAQTLITIADKRNASTASMREVTKELKKEHEEKRKENFGDIIANSITEQIMKEQPEDDKKPLSREVIYNTVRFGPTLKKMMNANPTYPEKMANYASSDPAYLYRKYKEQANKMAMKDAQMKAEEAAKKEIKEVKENKEIDKSAEMAIGK